MSGTAIINYLLSNNSGVLAVVPTTSIKSGVVPIGTPMPAISVTTVSAVPLNTVSMAETKRFITERVQVTAQGKTYASMKQVLALVRAALPLSRGTINGFACDSILPGDEGPDFEDVDAVLHMGSQDFMVRFTR